MQISKICDGNQNFVRNQKNSSSTVYHTVFAKHFLIFQEKKIFYHILKNSLFVIFGLQVHEGCFLLRSLWLVDNLFSVSSHGPSFVPCLYPNFFLLEHQSQWIRVHLNDLNLKYLFKDPSPNTVTFQSIGGQDFNI